MSTNDRLFGPSRRRALRTIAGLAGGLALGPDPARAEAPRTRLATFTADVTPPIGHPCMGGGIAPVREIVDPLYARGIVLEHDGARFVIAAVDWCEIRNDAYDRWRTALARAAGTEPARVLLSSIHQHDAPVADLEAERILESRGRIGRICDLDFHERAVQRTAAALADGLRMWRRVTHQGVGRARVDRVASNRRYIGPDGKPGFGRMSATRDPVIRAYPEGTIDPFLRTLSFWDGARPLAALSFYAVHPMSYYGQGGASSDFVGLARRSRQEEMPEVFQMYLSGCSGNVVAGKYNDGAPENRPALAGRLLQAMRAAWESTRREPIEDVRFRAVPLRLEPRNDAGFTAADLTERLEHDPKPFGQCLAALGLSWRKRADAGHTIDVPVLDLGRAAYVLLPGESYVEYQLRAQRLRPDVFVAGYGECATGYVPTEQAIREGDANLHDWCWVAPGSERAMTTALEQALRG
jgi:hypothetical protein